MKSRIAYIIAVVLFCPVYIHAQARVSDAVGTVEKKVSSSAQWQTVSVGDVLSPDTSLRTGTNSAILLAFPDRHVVRIGEYSELRLRELGQNSSYSFQLLNGQIWSFVNKAKKPAKYDVETPSTVLGVSGTLFHVNHDTQTNESNISVADGVVSVGRGSAVQRVQKGFQTRVRQGQTGRASVTKLDTKAREMWDHLRKSENWTKGNAAPQINRQTESRLRTLQEERSQRQPPQQPQKGEIAKPPVRKLPPAIKRPR